MVNIQHHQWKKTMLILQTVATLSFTISAPTMCKTFCLYNWEGRLKMNKAVSAPKEFITQYKLVLSMICFTFVNWIILCLFLLSMGEWVVHTSWAAVYTRLLSGSKTEFCSDCAFEDLARLCKVTSHCSLVCSFLLLGNLKPCCLPLSTAVKISNCVENTGPMTWIP